MKTYLVKTPKFVQRMFPKRIWAFPISEKKIYLTFDDGPIPEVTPWVLDTLQKYNAKATFFCIGDNVVKYPEIFRRIITEGHAVGNHTFNHLNGRKTEQKSYSENVQKSQTTMQKELLALGKSIITSEENDAIVNNGLFRPPYGRLTTAQAKTLQQKGYQIVMWNVLSADFDSTVSEEKCFKNVAESIQPGSIIVFHDSLRAQKNMQFALPKILDIIAENGWSCEKI
ncbi:MAG: polysaccharide deacetylase family protein [Flavobacteriaceae bacterium]|nr:polysaccharide deacetylase family protein [Flavobacteriaceae bacterium]